jgi:hypothetical protein
MSVDDPELDLNYYHGHERVKHGHESRGPRNKKNDCAGDVHQQFILPDPTLWSDTDQLI